MSLINHSLEHVYYSNLVSNHIIIRLIRFVTRFTVHLCNTIYFLTTFSIPYKRFTKNWSFGSKQDLIHIQTRIPPPSLCVRDRWIMSSKSIAWPLHANRACRLVIAYGAETGAATCRYQSHTASSRLLPPHVPNGRVWMNEWNFFQKKTNSCMDY